MYTISLSLSISTRPCPHSYSYLPATQRPTLRRSSPSLPSLPPPRATTLIINLTRVERLYPALDISNPSLTRASALLLHKPLSPRRPPLIPQFPNHPTSFTSINNTQCQLNLSLVFSPTTPLGPTTSPRQNPLSSLKAPRVSRPRYVFDVFAPPIPFPIRTLQNAYCVCAPAVRNLDALDRLRRFQGTRVCRRRVQARRDIRPPQYSQVSSHSSSPYPVLPPPARFSFLVSHLTLPRCHQPIPP